MSSKHEDIIHKLMKVAYLLDSFWFAWLMQHQQNYMGRWVGESTFGEAEMYSAHLCYWLCFTPWMSSENPHTRILTHSWVTMVTWWLLHEFTDSMGIKLWFCSWIHAKIKTHLYHIACDWPLRLVWREPNRLCCFFFCISLTVLFKRQAVFCVTRGSGVF